MRGTFGAEDLAHIERQRQKCPTCKHQSDEPPHDCDHPWVDPRRKLPLDPPHEECLANSGYHLWEPLDTPAASE